MTTRRDFLRSSAIAGGALIGGLGPTLANAASTRVNASARSDRAFEPLDILVLGGTGFIGPHLVRHAVARGHRVTIFSRGRRDADLPESVKRLVGDRDGKLDALKDKTWDAVVDDSATNPDWVRQSTALLKGSVGRYLFTSSTGVHYPYLKRGIDESVPPLMENPDPKDGSADYGVKKAQCEKLTQDAFGENALIVRPTYIIGPGDSTDRFPYWPVRLARGGEVLAPGRRDDPVQFIDGRDLTAFMIKLLEDERGGVYDVAGPRTTMTVTTFLDEARKALNPSVKYTVVDDYDFLVEHKIYGLIPWALLAGNNMGMMSIKNDRSIAAGLDFRPIADTCRDTLAWWPSVPAERQANPKFGITPEQERAALEAWHARGRR